MPYHNPVLPGFYPDPSICRVSRDYYLVTSSFEYFPGVPIFKSHDLVHWQQIGHCLTRTSQFPVGGAYSSGGIFAPTLRWHAGTFYMITTNVNGGGNFIVHTQDPAGEWSDPIWLDQAGIDPSLYFDEDGRAYFTGTNGGQIVLRQINVQTGEFQSPETGVWQGSGGQHPEAPHLYKRNGLYYLLISEGGTEYGHMVTIARSQQLMGPYESCPRNPILSHRSLFSPIQATGHADLVQAEDGQWWCVCLGIRPNGYPPCHHLGRETFLAPVHWDEAGWPVMGENGRIALEMDGISSAGVSQAEPEAFFDDFDSTSLGLDWNFLHYTTNSPRMDRYSLAARPGWLQLNGSAENLDQTGAVTFVGLRQRYLVCSLEARFDFSPQAENEEAGITLRQNELHHYEIAISIRAGQRCVFVRRRTGSLVAETVGLPISLGPVTLKITADASSYTFYYELDGEQPVKIIQAESRYLSTEVAGGFTGVFVGLYATGNGIECPTPASVDWFKVLPQAAAS